MRRFRHFVIGFMAVFCIASLSPAAQPGQLVLVAAGDVEWSGNGLGGGGAVIYDDGGKNLLEGGWQPIPRLMTAEAVEALGAVGEALMAARMAEYEKSYGATAEHISTTYVDLKVHDLEFDNETEWAEYPFQRIAPLFRAADFAFINLETPLSDDAYRVGVFRTPTAFVQGLTFAGIDIASLANNHMLDAERDGMFDTIATLEAAGITPIGAGDDLEDARAPAIIEHDGVRIAMLAYTQYENAGLNSFANTARAGVVPLDPLIIKEDIRRVRDQVDHVVLSFHWDIYHFDVSRSSELHPGAVEFAREMIDAGADAVLGHHPHVPRAVEMYRGKPILYSMAHLIFSFGLPQWGDNYVARLTFSKERVEQVEILPVAGRWDDLAQPYLLEGERARGVLDKLQALSNHLGTRLEINGNAGLLRPADAGR